MVEAQTLDEQWILVLGGEKGGPGKSCLAQNLSVAIKLLGGDVLLVDADPQATSYEWANIRDRNGALVSIPHEKAHGDISTTLKDRAKRYSHIIVDCGGADSEALRSAMTVASHLLIPLRPKRRDLATLEKLEILTRLAKSSNPKIKIKAVITQCPSLPSQAIRILDAKDACMSFGIEPLNAITMSRNAYDDAEEDGSSVIESNTDLKAKEEIEKIADELFGEHKWA
ncbi:MULTISPECIES: AAA family ATPase [Pseudomonas syringae group]|uniref:ParA family protein n=9 Tax=Pseudomonas syringae group TaxID=136849 RepID=A0A2K4X3S9_PSESX|nr:MULTISPECIES: AAA family ATPase [Pseudomonas syringae group]AVB17601.1 chromosome partitioning protein ParA [Pseudomonas amygdali pv. morsprunorum]EGH05241.1 ParA family protein [Pseudomonas amygdali pv. aesculi str. 0893_23]KAA3532825.1 chromosome partitioning protein ParA [Pseudomonas savastanoi]KOP51023.1 ParA family protein [Pseudomonas coronafaciens pv. porri]KOP57348.1 ParA family protein [Pseudomonas coronafaciens pv. porri]